MMGRWLVLIVVLSRFVVLLMFCLGGCGLM